VASGVPIKAWIARMRDGSSNIEMMGLKRHKALLGFTSLSLLSMTCFMLFATKHMNGHYTRHQSGVKFAEDSECGFRNEASPSVQNMYYFDQLEKPMAAYGMYGYSVATSCLMTVYAVLVIFRTSDPVKGYGRRAKELGLLANYF
jgi:hypothetical protein